jgi:hypothetical protein
LGRGRIDERLTRAERRIERIMEAAEDMSAGKKPRVNLDKLKGNEALMFLLAYHWEGGAVRDLELFDDLVEKALPTNLNTYEQRQRKSR